MAKYQFDLTIFTPNDVSELHFNNLNSFKTVLERLGDCASKHTHANVRKYQVHLSGRTLVSEMQLRQLPDGYWAK